MKNKIFTVLFLICAITFIISAGYLMIQTFVQIDMTKTRFAITYWKEELAMTISALLGMRLLFRNEE